MRTIEDIRHARLLMLLEEPRFARVQALADELGKSYAQVSQWKNRSKRQGGGVSNIDSASARLIEEKVGKEVGWMDNDPELVAGGATSSSEWPFSGDLLAELGRAPQDVVLKIEYMIKGALAMNAMSNPIAGQTGRRKSA